ncbi:MAG: aldo/keto reductase [Myxococcales bacterium]|nr:aldo/keto reductase [Myxococcales bacterium]
MQTDFTHAALRTVDKKVHRLGLALNMGIDADGVAAAFERGVSYVFYTRLRTGKSLSVLREALQRDRERYVVAAGPSFAFYRGNVRRAAESILKRLGTDYIDVFQLMWLGATTAFTDGIIDELVKLREEGKVRALGVSIHDRDRAGRLAADSILDLFMIRYNAAHPGAERDIFPHLEKRKPSIVAYTATSWRKLLRRPSGYDGPVMTAGDCYRFCLSSPHVDVVLTGPKSRAELEQNLDAVERGPLGDDELAWMRRFGQVVHG